MNEIFVFKEGIVPRDIGGIYFLIDIHDNTYSGTEEIFSANRMGYIMACIMKRLDTFSIDDIFAELIKVINNYNSNMDVMIKSDIANYIKELIKLGYVERKYS